MGRPKDAVDSDFGQHERVTLEAGIDNPNSKSHKLFVRFIMTSACIILSPQSWYY